MSMFMILIAVDLLSIGGAYGAQISITVQNASSDSSNVRVFDLFANDKRDVNNGTPFPLAAGATTDPIGINANADGTGTIEWDCNPGGSVTNVVVQDRATVQACQ